MKLSANLEFSDKLTIERKIAEALRDELGIIQTVELLHRERTPYQSTFPCEILTLMLGGETRRLFCKYEGGRRESRTGHRRAVAYEVDVYRRILAPLEVSSPRFFCGLADPTGAESWLLIDYVEPAVPISKALADPPAVVQSAAWIGNFHARSKSVVGAASFLARYDTEYFLRWPNAVLEQDSAFIRDNPWLAALLQRYREQVQVLTSHDCVVHGEFYPDNILFTNGAIVPVDWQTAAIGAGEIDLAVLTHGNWGDEVVAQCERAYRLSRWPAGEPADFVTRLALARVYWLTRVLAEEPGWIASEEYLSELRGAAKALQIIE